MEIRFTDEGVRTLDLIDHLRDSQIRGGTQVGVRQLGWHRISMLDEVQSGADTFARRPVEIGIEADADQQLVGFR